MQLCKSMNAENDGMCWKMRYVLLTKGVDSLVYGDSAPIFQPERREIA